MLKIAWSDIYAHPLPENHRFPMSKYPLLREQLLYEGTVEEADFFEPIALERSEIIATHTPDYWDRLRYLQLSKSEIRKTGFPLSEALVHREIVIAGGTLAAARYAMETGVAMNIAGGTHHAFTDRGEGFCLLNDMAIAANCLLAEGSVGKVLMLDLDVHQGNGTAEIFQGKEEVFTFSMHGAKNYPAKKEISDMDIGLPDGIGDEDYLSVLEEHLPDLLHRVRPDIVFFQSGVDVLATDKLGRLGLSREGCRLRDRFVFRSLQDSAIPVVVSMGGGYSVDIKDIIEAHANTFRLAQDIYF